MMKQRTEQFELTHAGQPFRVRCDRPSVDPVGYCILVQSGQMGKYDETGANGELPIYQQLTERLNEQGIGVVRFDMMLRDDLSSPASEEHIAERIGRLRMVCECSFLSGLPVVLCGMSLGAHCIWEVITSPDDRAILHSAILIGFPVDEARVVGNSHLQEVHLVYGSLDYIAYLDEEKPDEIVPIAPTDYSQWSLENLLPERELRREAHILDGLGHTLAPGTGIPAGSDPVSFILQLIKNAIKMVNV